MKIVYVTANLPYGTDEAFLVPEIAALKALGHEVLIVPRSPRGGAVHGQHLIESSVSEGLISSKILRSASRISTQKWRVMADRIRSSRSTSVAAKNLAILPKAAWLAEIASRWKADHIHCHWAGTTATMAMAASEWSGIPWSFTLHRWDIVENNLLVEKARSASLVRFISEDGLSMARERGLPASDHVRVIHMGVEMPSVRSTPGRQVCLCPARLVEIKGHRYLLEAWKKVRELGIRARLWLAGDGPLRSSIEAQATALNIRDSVRLLGTVSHSVLLEMYKSGGIALTVLPSIELGNGGHEGIPVALMEAMSYGVPVIGTRAGGTPELIRNGSGVIVEPGNVPELASAIQSMLDHPGNAQRLGERGRCHVDKEFNVTNTTAALVDAFSGRQAEYAEACAVSVRNG
jgi:glycosyltransferase involved in cell wall biosynthesis